MTTRIVALILIVLMSGTTFITQRQLIVKNTAPDNPMVKQQKIMLYVFPLIFAVGGINFPIGVLIYWFTTNVWSMGQQFYVIRNNPQPGTPAEKALEDRKKAKAARKAARNGEAPVLTAAEIAAAEGPTEKGASTQNRQQPKRQPKSKRQPTKSGGGAGSGASGGKNGSQQAGGAAKSSSRQTTKKSSGGKQSGTKRKSGNQGSGNQGKGGKGPS